MGRFLFPAGGDCRDFGTQKAVFILGWGLCRDLGTQKAVFVPGNETIAPWQKAVPAGF